MDWDPPAVGTVTKNGVKSEPKGDFAISLEALVEAGINTGFLAMVKRAVDGKTKWEYDSTSTAGMTIIWIIVIVKLFLICSQCFFSMESASNKTKFLSQINSSFGSGRMSLAMSDLQFARFILHLKRNQQGMPIRRAACVIGQQPCTNVWVLGKELQVSN